MIDYPPEPLRSNNLFAGDTLLALPPGYEDEEIVETSSADSTLYYSADTTIVDDGLPQEGEVRTPANLVVADGPFEEEEVQISTTLVADIAPEEEGYKLHKTASQMPLGGRPLSSTAPKTSKTSLTSPEISNSTQPDITRSLIRRERSTNSVERSRTKNAGPKMIIVNAPSTIGLHD